jgi:hypothetical protein
MIDAADDGPEVEIIRFFRLCPEGSLMRFYMTPGKVFGGDLTDAFFRASQQN